MGVIKIRPQGPGKDNYVHQYPVEYTEDELVEDGSFLVGEEHNKDPDDSYISDNGCEYGLVNDQICNIPYELYELTDLNEILCLETWNLCLTEEERFDLAAYLPDMDQETFDLTMIELLRGDNLFFGSPLEILFHRLKGGFYSLQVTHLREGLKFLQEQRFCHSLRSYHDSMTQRFIEMRTAWSICQPNTTVEERVQIWNHKINQRLVFPVDLNMFPLDEDLPSKGEKKVSELPPWRKATFMNEEVTTHVPSMDSNTMTLISSRKAKGVLKLKPPKRSAPKKIVLKLPPETWEPVRRSPKGVLKLMPKVHHTSLVERSWEDTVPLGHVSGSVFDVTASKLSPSHSSSQWQEKNITKKLNYAHQLVENGSIYRGSPIPELQGLHIGSRLSDNTRCSSRKFKVAKGLRMSSCESSGFGECFDSQLKETLWASSGLYQSARDTNQRELMPLHTNVSEAVSRNLITINDYEMFPTSTDHSEHQCRDMDSEGVEKSLRFPITYKRKKPHTQLSALQNQIKSSTVASILPPVPIGIGFKQAEKTNAIRIRVKGWNEFSS